jgi:hypothetical protein
MRLSHWSRSSTLAPHSVDQSPEGRGDKPRGLWVSVDGEDDWPSWCHREGFAEDRLVHRFRVTLADDADILHLDCDWDIHQFTRDYGVALADITGRFGLRDSHWIDWPRIAQKWQGIIIAPYCWGSRLEIGWYYGWDCASGCIWDASAIASVAEIPTTSGVAA